MAVGSRPFAYNTGAPIAGTTQVGDLAVGTPTAGFESTGLTWWNGPGEGSGWIIAQPKPLGQPTPVFGHAMILSTTYKGVEMILSNGNRTIQQLFGYEQSILGNTLINNNDKVMFSVSLSLIDPPNGADSHFVGFGTRSMNVQGNPYGAFPGNDNQSIGFNSIGQFFFNGNPIASGLQSFGDTDTIDVAVNMISGLIWIRVNGHDWNNDPSENPSTGVGSLNISGFGLTSFYPVLCPGYEGTMTISSTPTFPVPVGFQFAGSNESASVGFLRSHVRTDASFVTLVNEKFGQSFALTGAGATTAKNWLNTNGYWTNR
jgi:hypothetical protein